MTNFPVIASAVILIGAYIAISTEKVHKAIIALIGASLVMLLKLMSASEAFSAIDFNVIFLLMGMMIIVNITSHTGVFQWLAIKAAKIARGKPIALLIIFSVLTAVVSAFLDNVTTVLLVGPVTLLIARELKVDPVPFMISEALASNIGGTATLIGDPPNIMIGSAANLSFLDFGANLAPGVLIILFFFCLVLWVVFRKRLQTTSELMAHIQTLDEKKAITDKSLLIKSLIVIGAVIAAFLVHSQLGYEPGEIALAGAAILLLLKGGSPEETLKEVDWTTLLFFIGLFIVVGATVKAGLINLLAKGLLDITKGNPIVTGLVILWASAFLSAFIDNIPYVATMIPLILALKGSMDVTPLWWALSLGACLGGNGTLVGASANVVISGIAGKSGYPVHFLRFTKYGLPIMILTLIISSAYLLLRYYMPLSH